MKNQTVAAQMLFFKRVDKTKHVEVDNSFSSALKNPSNDISPLQK
jgi:hypothetical protein